jgi:hypothetical protein
MFEMGSLLQHLAKAYSCAPIQLFGSLKNLNQRLWECFRYFKLGDRSFLACSRPDPPPGLLLSCALSTTPGFRLPNICLTAPPKGGRPLALSHRKIHELKPTPAPQRMAGGTIPRGWGRPLALVESITESTVPPRCAVDSKTPGSQCN